MSRYSPLHQPPRARADSSEESTAADGPCECLPKRIRNLVLRCCLYCALPVTMATGALYFALTRNYNCYAGALEGVSPAYGGELFPRHIILKERRNPSGLQFTTLVDVYDASDNTHVGYFYDMNFIFFMRFGFSDASDRIWFEARRPWFSGATSLSQWWYRALVYQSEHLYLQRCDDGLSSRHSGIFYIDENTTVRPWWCKDRCMKILDLASQDEDQATAPTPMAEVRFNYTLEWYYGGFKTRQAWNMLMTDVKSKATIASAHQNFALQNSAYLGGGQMYLSRWHVNVEVENPQLPNWVIAFMAVLDDVDEGTSDE